MAQQVILDAQLVPKYQTIGRCNNYAVLQSIPCSPECKIVGQILLDHPFSYDLTATTDVPAVVGYQGFIDKVSPFYTNNLAQQWHTMFKVFNRCLTTRTSGHDQTKINIDQMFHAMINRTNVDHAALIWWDFMNNVKQKKEAIQYPRFNKLIITDLMKKFLEIPQRIKEDYHFIKDDIPLVNVYTTGDVRVRGMLIPDEFMTEEIRATNEFKEYETVFMNVDVTMNQPQVRDEIAKATLLSLTLHKTALATEAQENISKVQERLAEEEIEKMVEGDEDEESYASEFVDSVLNDDVDDSSTRLEPGSHKENPEKLMIMMHILRRIRMMMKFMEIRKEQKQRLIPSPTRSPRNVSSSQKIVFEELTTHVSPTTATTSKDSSITKHKKQSISFSKIRETLDHCNKVVPDVTFAKTKEMITQEMPRIVNLAVNKDREVDPINAKEIIAKEFATHIPKMIEELFRKHMQNTTLNLYPTTSSPTAAKSSADLQQQLYLNMKSRPQDQAANPELWEILKAKFEKQ
ncbi:hypothetical protein Tco_1183463 [Tanacetum coccineum]